MAVGVNDNSKLTWMDLAWTQLSQEMQVFQYYLTGYYRHLLLDYYSEEYHPSFYTFQTGNLLNFGKVGFPL